MIADVNAQLGSYRVKTATGSIYLLDMANREMLRFPAEAPPAEDHIDVGTSCLRRDGQAVPLHKIIRLTIGLPAIFLLQVRTDLPVLTLRTTSRVTDISPLQSPDEGQRVP